MAKLPAMPQNRGRQKQIEKKKKARTDKRKADARSQLAIPSSQSGLIQLGAKQPFGPAYLSSGWDDPDHAELVTALVTRRLPDGRLLMASAIVDRTCLGIKDGWVPPPLTTLDLADRVEQFFRAHPDGGEPVDVVTVQSVVFHAVDYAAKLGFVPHKDFAQDLFGPRPEVLVDTPWANAPKPIYISGPYDNVPVILAQLQRVTGDDGYSFLAGMSGGDDFDDDDELDEGDDGEVPELP